jgi:hypothetical protein
VTLEKKRKKRLSHFHFYSVPILQPLYRTCLPISMSVETPAKQSQAERDERRAKATLFVRGLPADIEDEISITCIRGKTPTNLN